MDILPFRAPASNTVSFSELRQMALRADDITVLVRAESTQLGFIRVAISKAELRRSLRRRRKGFVSARLMRGTLVINFKEAEV